MEEFVCIKTGHTVYEKDCNKCRERDNDKDLEGCREFNLVESIPDRVNLKDIKGKKRDEPK
jgi:hypothetical protein